MTWIDAEKIENNQGVSLYASNIVQLIGYTDIELGWAIKASIHAETYMKLITAVPEPSQIKLTPYALLALQNGSTAHFIH